jgi:hypothetical protein
MCSMNQKVSVGIIEDKGKSAQFQGQKSMDNWSTSCKVVRSLVFILSCISKCSIEEAELLEML